MGRSQSAAPGPGCVGPRVSRGSAQGGRAGGLGSQAEPVGRGEGGGSSPLGSSLRLCGSRSLLEPDGLAARPGEGTRPCPPGSRRAGSGSGRPCKTNSSSPPIFPSQGRRNPGAPSCYPGLGSSPTPTTGAASGVRPAPAPVPAGGSGTLPRGLLTLGARAGGPALRAARPGAWLSALHGQCSLGRGGPAPASPPRLRPWLPPSFLHPLRAQKPTAGRPRRRGGERRARGGLRRDASPPQPGLPLGASIRSALRSASAGWGGVLRGHRHRLQVLPGRCGRFEAVRLATGAARERTRCCDGRGDGLGADGRGSQWPGPGSGLGARIRAGGGLSHPLPSLESLLLSPRGARAHR